MDAKSRMGYGRMWPLSNPLHKPVQHALLPGAVEVDGELVAFDGGDVAVAEFEVEDAAAGLEF